MKYLLTTNEIAMVPRVNRMPPIKLQPSNLRVALSGRIVSLFLQGEVLFLKFGIKIGSSSMIHPVKFSVVVLVITSVVVVIVVVLLIASVVASVTGFILIVVVELFEDKNWSL